MSSGLVSACVENLEGRQLFANAAPVVSAGPDVSLTLPNRLTLNGTATDDGQPSPAKLTVGWSVVSGPGVVTFANSALAKTTATFSVGGEYVLKLSAGDGEFTTADEITVKAQGVTPTPGNTAPTVNAGEDETLTLPNGATTLFGSAIDDGRPTPSRVTTAWTVVSGPGTVTFGNKAAVRTTATFTVAGTYVLRLTAGDGELSAFDEKTVTVLPVPGRAKLSGFAFFDANANGRFDGTEVKDSNAVVFLDTNNDGKLTAGESSVNTDADGLWSFSGLTGGTYRVRRELLSGMTYTTSPINISIGNTLSVSGLALGVKTSGNTNPNPNPTPGTGSISGSLFWDNNRNAKQDSGEVSQGGKVVFIDLDNDGVLDSNEQRTTTDSSGNFKFSNLAAGTYKIRRVLASGLVTTTSPLNLTLTAGGVITGVKIGTIEKK